MEAKEFYKRINEKYSWYNNVPLEVDLWGNMLKNDPADHVLRREDYMSDESLEGYSDSELFEVEATSQNAVSGLEHLEDEEEELELPSNSELIVEGRGIPMLVNIDGPVITQHGNMRWEDFFRNNNSIPGLRIDNDGTIRYDGYFYEGRPVTEEEFNRLENGDIEGGISDATMLGPVGEDYELGDNYELVEEEIV